MPRHRTIIARKDIKEIAQNHARDLNAMITLTNNRNREKAEPRLAQFIHEALGRLEIGELIAEYEELENRMSDLRRRWTAFMGEGQYIEGYTKSSRLALVRRVSNGDTNIPAPLLDEIKKVSGKYGIDMNEVVPIGQVQVDQLVERLARCDSAQEMEYILAQNTAQVLATVGVAIAPADQSPERRPNGAV